MNSRSKHINVKPYQQYGDGTLRRIGNPPKGNLRSNRISISIFFLSCMKMLVSPDPSNASIVAKNYSVCDVLGPNFLAVLALPPSDVTLPTYRGFQSNFRATAGCNRESTAAEWIGATQATLVRREGVYAVYELPKTNPLGGFREFYTDQQEEVFFSCDKAVPHDSVRKCLFWTPVRKLLGSTTNHDLRLTISFGFDFNDRAYVPEVYQALLRTAEPLITRALQTKMPSPLPD